MPIINYFKNYYKKLMQKIESDNLNYYIIILFTIGIFIRLVLLGANPVGLNQDEAATGYDAFAILKYGIDRNGFHLPVHLVSWGSGQYALYAYLSMPFIFLFGLSVFSLRFLSAVMGVLSLYLIYDIVKRIYNKEAGVFALFALTINPWHIMVSRWALDCNLFPAVFLLGFFFLIRYLHNGKKWMLWLSFFMFGLCLYAYGAAYFFIPAFIVMMLIYLLVKKKITLSAAVIPLLIFFITALPIGLFLLINFLKLPSIETAFFSIPRLSGVARYNTVSTFFSSDFLKNSWKNFQNFLNMFFLTQQDGRPWNSFQNIGFMYMFSLPFLAAGFYKNIKEKNNINFLLVIWFAAALILTFTMDPNINRSNIIFFPVIIFIALGLFELKNKSKIFLQSSIVIYIIFFLFFSFQYFTKYPKTSSDAFMESLGAAINYAKKTASPDEKIYITHNHINMPYIFVLFYGKENPWIFKNTVKYYNPGQEFQWVRTFDRYYFGEIRDSNTFTGNIYILHNSEGSYFRNPDFNIRRFKNFSVAVRK